MTESIEKLTKALDEQKATLATQRDALRELSAEADQMADDIDEAISHMESAADALSRLV
jgi:methyl-accepting chemotaxis protein